MKKWEITVSKRTKSTGILVNELDLSCVLFATFKYPIYASLTNILFQFVNNAKRLFPEK